MNKVAGVVTLLLGLAACAPTPVAPTAQPTVLRSTPQPATQTIAVIAHRGGAGLAPENTLGAFRNALALGVDYLEMDVHLSADGEPMVIHDPTLERTTNGSGRVAAQPAAQLRTLNAAAKFPGTWSAREPVPTFGEVLELAQPTRVRIEVEIKVPPQGRYAGIEQRMLNLLSERRMLDRVQLSSFDFGVLADLRKLNAQVRSVALLSADFFRRVPLEMPERVLAEVQAAGADVLAVNKDYLSAGLVQAAHARRLSVEVWTVDDEAEMRKFIQMGVDGLISNRPDLLQAVLHR